MASPPPKQTQTHSSSSVASNPTTTTSRQKSILNKYSSDAAILSIYESSPTTFNYSHSLSLTHHHPLPPPRHIHSYLSNIQRSGLLQPFGCLLAFDPIDPNLPLLAFSSNAPSLLLLSPLLGADVRTLFIPTSSASLVRALSASADPNPLSLTSASKASTFHATLHRIDVGVLLDLEPALPDEPAPVRAVSRLKSVSGGDVAALCDAVVKDVRALTGYDRVMVYKFHGDGHGEVVSEVRRPDMRPFLGLHYPAADVPQASRFMFKLNRVRMIHDCRARPTRVIQDDRHLKEPLVLVNSILRAPHACHAEYLTNMGVVGTLVLAVIVNLNGSMRLWGLVVCHHGQPRRVSYNVRLACEFLMQAFSLQVGSELQLAARVEEKRMLRTQLSLCDMLVRGDASITSIISRSPNLGDLVKCDGAGLYYKGKCGLVGVTPDEGEVERIVNWLVRCHVGAMGLSTDSLVESGYPGALSIGDDVCGLAAVRVGDEEGDFLLWFRSHAAKKMKWEGEDWPEDPENAKEGRMHPRASYEAFLEVVKHKSWPWEAAELNAMHLLQLIVRSYLKDGGERYDVAVGELEAREVEEVGSIAYEMVRMIRTALAPVVAVDSRGIVNGWNSGAVELTGLAVDEAVGKSLVGELVCEDVREVVGHHLSRALHGEEDKNVELKLRVHGSQKENCPAVVIVANACSSRDHMNNVIGVCFMGQDVTKERIIMDKLLRLKGDYRVIAQSLNPLIPPIFASDENNFCCEWNAAMEGLTGWMREDVIGKSLIGEVFGGFVPLKGQDALIKFNTLLQAAKGGHDTETFPFSFMNKEGEYVEALLTPNRRADIGGGAIGCFFFLQTPVANLQEAFEAQREQENKCRARLNELAYIKQELRNPLAGIQFIHQLFGTTNINETQRQCLETSAQCGRQIMKILEDTDLTSIENGRIELARVSFPLGRVFDVTIGQVMLSLNEKNLQLILKIPDIIKTVSVFGDEVRLQQVLAEFLMNIVHHLSSRDSWVEIAVIPSLSVTDDGIEILHLQISMAHPGVASELIQDIFHGKPWSTWEGLGLVISINLIKMMNGTVKYIREITKCYLLIDIEFPAH
ncbi:Phytochrome B [Acorus calamus]|uniref:Phytochrome B n=1 Tax=Acorus calamus TaxID=4465 RepID=A0AAV9DA87_ACOCL|nr:Phytochrome B [Acorus calamus]